MNVARRGPGGTRSDGNIDRSAPRGRLAGGTSGFSLLGEALFSGVIVAVASIPLMTALPATAAAVRHLRRHLAGEPDGWGELIRDLLPAVRALWWAGTALVLALAVLGFNFWLANTGALPGGPAISVISALMAAAVLVVALRLAARWTGGPLPVADLRAAALRARTDVLGSLLLVGALLASGALVWMLLPMLLIIGGLLAMAVVAVEFRWATYHPERS